LPGCRKIIIKFAKISELGEGLKKMAKAKNRKAAKRKPAKKRKAAKRKKRI